MNPDPNVFETTLISNETTVDLGNGVTAHAQAFNGAIPGPTFRLKVGDTVIVHYENHLTKPTRMHWHGIELTNSMDGTPFMQNRFRRRQVPLQVPGHPARGSTGTTRTTTRRRTRCSRACTG